MIAGFRPHHNIVNCMLSAVLGSVTVSPLPLVAFAVLVLITVLLHASTLILHDQDKLVKFFFFAFLILFILFCNFL